jgi:predicted 3-demethylubiquinone-9 3-methyltransferase (glyoxalase superfamily)
MIQSNIDITHLPMNLSPCLWFDGHALEAANYYVDTFPNSGIRHIAYYGDGHPYGKSGDVMMIVFSLDGNIFRILNGGSFFKISPAVSWVIPCDTQEEMDHYYSRLSAVPEAEQCGWTQDQFGVSWQIIPNQFTLMMNSDDEVAKSRVMASMMEMKRLDIAKLETAYNS